MELASSGGIAVGGVPRKSWITGLVSAVNGEKERRKKGRRSNPGERNSFPPPAEKIVADGTDRKLFRAFRGLSESRTPFSCSHPFAIPPCATRDFPPLDDDEMRTERSGNLWRH